MSGPVQFRFDPGRCIGCETCVLACRVERREAVPLRRVHTFNGPKLPRLPVLHLSLACHHCRQPACVEHCPAGAYRTDPASGAVILRPGLCMGCRYCTWACPHDAPRYDRAQGAVAKCDLCQARGERGLEPACVARCPVGALAVEPRDEAAGGVLPPGFPATRTRPSIRFVPGLRPAPVLTAPPAPALAARCREALLRVAEPGLRLRDEWPLLAFTTILALLVALVAGGPHPLPRPWILPGAGALCLALGACHLGRPGRAWRALVNLRRSWLSREAALALAFLVLACFPRVPALRWAAAAAGFAALFAVDRVYQVAVRTSRLDFHSAHALFNGLYLTGLLAGCWPLALAAGALKAWLYLGRKAHFRRQGRPARPWLSLLRVGLGFVLPALAFGSGAAALGAVLGDLADRWEYYGELRFPSPGRQMAQDLITLG